MKPIVASIALAVGALLLAGCAGPQVYSGSSSPTPYYASPAPAYGGGADSACGALGTCPGTAAPYAMHGNVD